MLAVARYCFLSLFWCIPCCLLSSTCPVIAFQPIFPTSALLFAYNSLFSPLWLHIQSLLKLVSDLLNPSTPACIYLHEHLTVAWTHPSLDINKSHPQVIICTAITSNTHAASAIHFPHYNTLRLILTGTNFRGLCRLVFSRY